MEELEVRQRGHRANVGGAAAAVAAGAIGGDDDDDPPPPSLQAAEVALAAVEILRDCCACECLLAAYLLRPALAPPSAGMCIHACMQLHLPAAAFLTFVMRAACMLCP